jgi:6-phosphogluconolactonase
VVADLGTDEFIVYALDSRAGTLTRDSAAKVKPGYGPRHFHFHPSYKYAYGLNEMGSAVTAFRWSERNGELEEIGNVTTLPSDFSGQNSCAEILVHPNGRFVYASNRGHNSIASFSVGGDGKLEPVERVSTGGRTPRNFRIDPTGRWLLVANQDSSNIVTFRLDPATGLLASAGEPTPLSMPVCIRFLT